LHFLFKHIFVRNSLGAQFRTSFPIFDNAVILKVSKSKQLRYGQSSNICLYLILMSRRIFNALPIWFSINFLVSLFIVFSPISSSIH